MSGISRAGLLGLAERPFVLGAHGGVQEPAVAQAHLGRDVAEQRHQALGRNAGIEPGGGVYMPELVGDGVVDPATSAARDNSARSPRRRGGGLGDPPGQGWLTGHSRSSDEFVSEEGIGWRRVEVSDPPWLQLGIPSLVSMQLPVKHRIPGLHGPRNAVDRRQGDLPASLAYFVEAVCAELESADRC